MLCHIYRAYHFLSLCSFSKREKMTKKNKRKLLLILTFFLKFSEPVDEKQVLKTGYFFVYFNSIAPFLISHFFTIVYLSKYLGRPHANLGCCLLYFNVVSFFCFCLLTAKRMRKEITHSIIKCETRTD